MRTLIWTDSDRFAGTERHCLDLSQSLRRLGHQVCVGARQHSPLAERVRLENGTLLPLGGKSAVSTSVRRLSGLLKRGEIDLIHAHNGVSAFLSCVASSHAGRGRVVVTEHFISPARARRRGVVKEASEFLHGWMGKRIRRWIAISEAVAKAIHARNQRSGSKVRLVLNGVASPSLDEPVREQAREKLGLSQTGLKLLCPARLEAEKGHATLLNALAMLRDEGVPFEALLIGGGSLFNWIEQRILELGLSLHVRLLGEQSNPGWWMQASDIVVLPSPMEPFGLVLAEAMSRGIPVVAADSGGPKEIVTPECGALFRSGDARDLACRLWELSKGPDRLSRMGAAAHQRWASCFSLERMAREVATVYDEAANGDH